MRTFRLGIAGGKVLSRACFSLLVISNMLLLDNNYLITNVLHSINLCVTFWHTFYSMI